MRSSNNANSVLSIKTCEGFCDTMEIRKVDRGRGFIFNQTEEHANQFFLIMVIKSGNDMLMTLLSLSRKIAYPNFTTN